MTTSHQFSQRKVRKRSTIDTYQSSLEEKGHEVVSYSPKYEDPGESKLRWDSRFVIKNLPGWVYTDFAEPTSTSECKALISAAEYTIADIDLQIEIKKADLDRKPSTAAHEAYQKWLSGALRAKQTNMYLLSAYNYWKLLSVDDEWSTEQKLRRVIELLQEEPEDFTQQLELLL
tara:strand:+ start:51 stop:572 length:522 start_codon:yes stop_codon:yes gene_type:complete